MTKGVEWDAHLSIDTATPSFLSTMRRDACERILKKINKVILNDSKNGKR